MTHSKSENLKSQHWKWMEEKKVESNTSHISHGNIISQNIGYSIYHEIHCKCRVIFPLRLFRLLSSTSPFSFGIGSSSSRLHHVAVRCSKSIPIWNDGKQHQNRSQQRIISFGKKGSSELRILSIRNVSIEWLIPFDLSELCSIIFWAGMKWNFGVAAL